MPHTTSAENILPVQPVPEAFHYQSFYMQSNLPLPPIAMFSLLLEV